MSLILDNCRAADEKEVRNIIAPAATDIWHPIPHGTIIDMLDKVLDAKGLNVVERNFALTDGKFQGKEIKGARLFGELVVEGKEDQGYRRAFGLRNSIDQHIAANICGGESIMVCGNMCFSGEFMVTRKHTSRIFDVLPEMIDDAVTTYLGNFGKREAQISHWKAIEVDEQLCDHVIMKARRARALVSSKIEPIFNEFMNPRHTDFKEKNVWNLHNAYTEIQKTRDVDPNVVASETVLMTEVLNNMFPVPEIKDAEVILN